MVGPLFIVLCSGAIVYRFVWWGHCLQACVVGPLFTDLCGGTIIYLHPVHQQ